MKIKLGFIKNIALLLMLVTMQIYAYSEEPEPESFVTPNEHFYHRTAIMPVLKAPKSDKAILEIEILSTGDLHEHKQYMDKISGIIEREKLSEPDGKATAKKVIVVDAGDLFCSPDPSGKICDKTHYCPGNNCGHKHLGRDGDVMAGLMEGIKYDAIAIGNHDLSYGTERFSKLANRYNLPIYAANKVKAPGDLRVKSGRLIKYTFGDLSVSVGVIGTMDPNRDDYHLVSKESKSNLEMRSVNTANVKEWIKNLGAKPDIVVLVTHQKDDSDENITGVDVVIGGHSHREIDKFTNGKMLVKDGAFGDVIGKTIIYWNVKEHRREDKIKSQLIRTH